MHMIHTVTMVMKTRGVNNLVNHRIKQRRLMMNTVTTDSLKMMLVVIIKEDMLMLGQYCTC